MWKCGSEMWLASHLCEIAKLAISSPSTRLSLGEPRAPVTHTGRPFVRSVDRSVRWSKRRPAGTLRSRMLGLQATGRVAAPNAGAEMSGGTKRVPGTSATAGAVRLAACSTRCRRKVDEPRSAKCGGWAAFRPFALVSSGEGRPRSSAGSLSLIAEERGSSLVAQALPPPP